jgi:tetratricopeptide (TPR) repeat protein
VSEKASESRPALEDVFAQFRDEASRRSAVDSARAQYARGLALYQAGEIEACLPALQAAAQAPALRFATSAMLGRIYRKQGQPPQAIEWFERAAQAPPSSPSEGHALLYDLADTLESVGETARALAVCLELQADAGNYKDVSARVDRLSRTQSRG